MILRLPFAAATEAERRTEAVRVVIPQRQFQVVTFDFDTSVVMNGNDLHFDDRLPVLVRFLPLDPMHEVAGAIRPAGTIPGHCSTPERSGLRMGGALAGHRLVPGRFVIRATHERGVGVPSSRSLATATHEADPTLRRLVDRGERLKRRDEPGLLHVKGGRTPHGDSGDESFSTATLSKQRHLEARQHADRGAANNAYSSIKSGQLS